MVRVVLLTLEFFFLMTSLTLPCTKGQHIPAYQLKGTKYPLVVFPLLDSLNVPQAFSHKNYLRFLLKCVFFEGHCDIMGKWLKPRAVAGLFGTCLACTKFQESKINSWLELLADLNPEEFRVAMIKICVDLELPVGQEDLNLIKPYYPKS